MSKIPGPTAMNSYFRSHDDADLHDKGGGQVHAVGLAGLVGMLGHQSDGLWGHGDEEAGGVKHLCLLHCISSSATTVIHETLSIMKSARSCYSLNHEILSIMKSARPYYSLDHEILSIVKTARSYYSLDHEILSTTKFCQSWSAFVKV